MSVALQVWKYAENMAEWIVQWQPLRCSICCYWHNYQIFLYSPVSNSCPCTPSLDSFTSQKSINCISWKQKRRCFSGSASAEGVFGNMEKRKLHMHAMPSLPHTLDIFLEQHGHCTSPTASRHGDFIPTSSTKEDAFGSIPTGHNSEVHNAAPYCTSRYPQHKPKLVIWTAKVVCFFFKSLRIE